MNKLSYFKTARDTEIGVRVRSALSVYGVLAPKLPSTFPRQEGVDLQAALEAMGLSCDGYKVVGELGMTGDVRHVRGLLSQGNVLGDTQGPSNAIVAWDNRLEASHAFTGDVYAVKTLADAVDVLKGNRPLRYIQNRYPFSPGAMPADLMALLPARLGEPHRLASEALQHGKVVHLHGKPGAGNTMIARRLVWSLPKLSYSEALLVSEQHSRVGILDTSRGLLDTRPFRAPHHTVSPKGLESETLLAKHGVLFLDELQEFSKSKVEAIVRAPDVRFVLASHELPGVHSEATRRRYAERLQALLGLFENVETINV